MISKSHVNWSRRLRRNLTTRPPFSNAREERKTLTKTLLGLLPSTLFPDFVLIGQGVWP